MKEKFFFYKCVVHEPIAPMPKGVRHYYRKQGIAGFKEPQNRTLEFYGTVAGFEEYLSKRKVVADRRNMYDAKGRP